MRPWYWASALAFLPLAVGSAQAAPIYLNDANISVALGASMSPEPFANRTTAASLASVIDAPSATAGELHLQSTHVWVSGGPLELDFDFGVEYDLTTLHFWNYHSESYDVDSIDFTFYDGTGGFVGELLDVMPALGNATGSDGDPIFAEDIALSFPSNVRYVNAFLTGSNNQVDFNNIGFTAELSDPNPDPTTVPEPWTLALLTIGVAGLGFARARRDDR
ncbi:MAG: PEP-CTERM sorting domain-containing protein [Tistlia sp.]|uniref:PEP-CTERM sorting domain-containing protein n=1 Tax=Tistlia sp. TaxID=3057121 RepID=UPI0034A2AB5D